MNTSLQTDRLRIEPLALDDVDIAIELWTDPVVVKYICDAATDDEMRRDMPDNVRRGARGAIGIWCISDRTTGEKIGSTYLLPMPTDAFDVDYKALDMELMPDGDIELGYFLKPSVWGLGYATEVGQCMISFAFRHVRLDEIVASVHEENAASRKVLEKIGFVHSGSTMAWGLINPIYRLSRDRWNETSG